MRKVISVILIIPFWTFAAAIVTSQERARRVAPSASSSTSSQEVGEGDVVCVDTALVNVPVGVMDRQGRFIYDLRKEDFTIFENSVKQDVAFFESVESPFTVVLMLDTSSSVWKKLDLIKDAAIGFVDQLRPADRVMVLSFAHKITVHSESTNDRERLRSIIRGIGKGMSTHLYDSVAKVMTKKLMQIEGRKAIVIFTDGVDESGDKMAKKTLRYAEELDALIYTIRFDTYDARMDTIMQAQRRAASLGGIFGQLAIPVLSAGSSKTLRDMYEQGRRYLQQLSDVTGGRYFEASRDLHDLDSSFAQIAAELRHQYRLGYYPKIHSKTCERRLLRIRVNRSDVAVRARNSFIYVPSRNEKQETFCKPPS